VGLAAQALEIARGIRVAFCSSMRLCLLLSLVATACSSGGGSRDCLCPAIYSPVCGSDGKTYGNTCEAQCAGVTVVHAGQCGGLCQSDNDCVFVSNSGCCGNCVARGDTPPPPLGCGIACPAEPPPCLCVSGHCGGGTLGAGASCDPQRDLCGGGLKCCATCCGAPPTGDGGFDPRPECTQPMFTPQGPMCPPLALRP